MKKIMRFTVRHPIVFGFILFLAFSILSTLTWPVTQLAAWPEGYEWGTSLAKLLIASCFILVLWGFGWLRESGFAIRGTRRIWLMAVGLLVLKAALGVYAFTGLFQFKLPAPEMILAVLAYTLMTSLLEETMYRGLLLRSMVLAWGTTRRGLVAAAALSGLFWGSMHFFSLLIRPFPVVGLQVLETTLSGFLYAALIMAGGSIWPVVLSHGLLNATINLQIVQVPNYQEPVAAWLLMCPLSLVLIGVAIPLIQKARLGNRSEFDPQGDNPRRTLEAISR